VSEFLYVDYVPGRTPLFRGKVRDVYDLGDMLLLVASDRLSAFDAVLPTPIPDRGRILTQLSAFWFRRTSSIVPNHLLSTDISDIAAAAGVSGGALDLLRGRGMLARTAARIDFEFVVRGYLAGSGFREYRRTGGIGGMSLPKGIAQGGRLPQPVLTPATKADEGHDVNVHFEDVADAIGLETARQLRDVSIALYRHMHDHAWQHGLVLADTKFEFGVADGQVLLIDEIGTPDSSRFWDRQTYERSGWMSAYDKQFVRDFLEEVGWNKVPPAPPLPESIVAATRARYVEAFQRLTELPLEGEGSN
jgi:phosphoribosylaminoimidazole-succinocarboxamide synthase